MHFVVSCEELTKCKQATNVQLNEKDNGGRQRTKINISIHKVGR